MSASAAPVGIALLSYERSPAWGFVADCDLVPDLHELVLDVQDELAKLRELPAMP